MPIPIALRKQHNKPYIHLGKDVPKIAIKLIDSATSYKIKNAEHIDSAMYTCPKCGWWKLKIHCDSDYCKRCGALCNSGIWDCVIRLLSKTRSGGYYFPAGLLENVINVLKTAGYEPVRSEWPSEPHGGIPMFNLTWSGWTLRSHQDEAKTKALAKLRRGRGAILEMPTGSGKTTLALSIIKELGVNTLILVHKKNLMEQWREAIKTTLNWDTELFGDNQKEIGPITIGMIQSISKSPNFDINQFDFVIADECHHVPADSTYNVLMKSNAYYKLGLSATPTREDGNEMKMFAAIGSIIKVSDVKELIKLGILAKPTIEFMQAPHAQQGNSYTESYKLQITMNQPRNSMIAQKAYELQRKGLSVLITVNQIRHGKTLETMIVGSKFIHGKTKKDERQKAMKDFENGNLRIMISTLLNEGSDIPTLDAIILASGGKSEAAQIQKVGRALRTTKEKKEALIIDVIDGGKWLRDHAQGRIQLYHDTF